MSLLQDLFQLNEKAAYVTHAEKGNLKAFIDSFEDKHNSSASIYLSAAQQKKLMKSVADGHEVKVLPFKSEDAVYKAEEELKKKDWTLLGDGDNGGGQVEAIFTRDSIKEGEIFESSESIKKLVFNFLDNLEDNGDEAHTQSLEKLADALEEHHEELRDVGTMRLVQNIRAWREKHPKPVKEARGSDDHWGPNADKMVKIKQVYDMIISSAFETWYKKDFEHHTEGEDDSKDEIAIINDLYKMLH